jgi:hypothetical protein
MRDDVWLEVAGSLQWFGRASGLDIWEADKPPE